MSTTSSTKPRTQNKPAVERFRLPVKFEGEFVIHSIDSDEDAAGSDSDDEEPSTQVEERWIPTRQIGKGGFGEVWLQTKVGQGQLRAVKRLPQVFRAVDFSRELATLAALVDHQRSFVRFYGWYEDIARDFVFLVMEYLAHGDLAQYVNDPIIRLETKEITRQLLEGLVIMHERRICHRDIKPQNVLVASLNPIWVKLADFGVSKLEQDTYLRTTTGTISYSAPELHGLLPRNLKPGDVYTNAVDMWSMGCLVHELLTTEIPFLQPEWVANSGSVFWSDVDPPERQADIDMIIEFCRGERIFPGNALQKSGASVSECSFVRGLLLPDPRVRMTASDALQSPWLLGEAGADPPDVVSLPASRQRLENLIRGAKLELFFPEVSATMQIQAERLTEDLIKRGCTRGLATSLQLLILYDLIILIDDSDSMKYSQDGEQVEQLQRLLGTIASVYTLAREQGILTVRFLNAPQDKQDVDHETSRSVLRDHEFGGVTRVGTELKNKVLDKFVSKVEMRKPLLVIVITDGPAEGESTEVLKNVITITLSELRKTDNISKGPQCFDGEVVLIFKALALQFIRIGNNPDGVELLQELANDMDIGKCVNFRQLSEFNHAVDSKEQWTAITQILLGAISPNWR